MSAAEYVDGLRFENASLADAETLGLDAVREALDHPEDTWVDESGSTWSRTATVAVLSNRSRSLVREVRPAETLAVPDWVALPLTVADVAAQAPAWVADPDRLAALNRARRFSRTAPGGFEVVTVAGQAAVLRRNEIVGFPDAATIQALRSDTVVDGWTIPASLYRFAYFADDFDLDTVIDTAADPDWTFDSYDGHQVAVKGEYAVVFRFATSTLRRFGPAAEIVNDRLPVTHAGVTMTSRVARLCEHVGATVEEIAATVLDPMQVWRGAGGLTMFRGPVRTVAARHTNRLVVAILDNAVADEARSRTHIAAAGCEVFVFDSVWERMDHDGIDRTRVAAVLNDPDTSTVNAFGNTVLTGDGLELTLNTAGELKWIDAAVRRRTIPAMLRPKVA